MIKLDIEKMLFLLEKIDKNDLYIILSKIKKQEKIEELYYKLSDWYITNQVELKQKSNFIKKINSTKTNDTKNKKIGKWKINSDGYYPYCSICKKEPKNRIITEICPYCGADLAESYKKYMKLLRKRGSNND